MFIKNLEYGNFDLFKNYFLAERGKPAAKFVIYFSSPFPPLSHGRTR